MKTIYPYQIFANVKELFFEIEMESKNAKLFAKYILTLLPHLIKKMVLSHTFSAIGKIAYELCNYENRNELKLEQIKEKKDRKILISTDE